MFCMKRVNYLAQWGFNGFWGRVHYCQTEDPQLLQRINSFRCSI